MSKVVIFMFTMCLVEFSQKELTGSQILPLLAAKFGWATEEDKDWNFTILSVFTLIGVILGSAASGKIMQSGRRRAIVIGVSTAIIGALMMQVLRFEVYVLGSFLVQFGTGMMEVC